ncbi:P2 family phage major capsid protein, partial [Acinetobacter baumannii]
MRNDTRKKFNHSLAKVAELNGVESAQVQFTVAPAPAQKMEEKIQASSEFLQKINVVPVEAQTGEAIGLSVNSTIAGRTDTSGNGERNPTDPTGFGVDKYECKQTN